MFASLNIIQDRLARSRLAGDPPDVTINPQVAHVGLVEFHRARELIDLGEEAMEAAIPTVRDALSFLQ
jgi:NTE family protein